MQIWRYSEHMNGLCKGSKVDCTAEYSYIINLGAKLDETVRLLCGMIYTTKDSRCWCSLRLVSRIASLLSGPRSVPMK